MNIKKNLSTQYKSVSKYKLIMANERGTVSLAGLFDELQATVPHLHSSRRWAVHKTDGEIVGMKMREGRKVMIHGTVLLVERMDYKRRDVG